MLGRGLFALLLLLPSSLWATTTVTGKMQNLGAGNITNGAYMRFWLRGCAGNQPRVNGSGLIAPSQGGVFFFDIAADASGNVSGTLYSTRDAAGTGNGDIECGGSKTAVWYGMQAWVAGKSGPEVAVHAKNGATLDITNVTPITTNPVVASPTGDTSYARLDAGNQPFTGRLSAPNYNDMLVVDGVTNTTCQAAVTAAGSTPTILIVPSAYAGAECPSTVVSTLTIWDLRSGSHTLTNNSVSWNQTSGGGLHTMARFIQQRVSPSGSDLALYGQSMVTGTLPNGENMDGASGEVDTYGAVTTPGGNFNVVGLEGSVVPGSTGGTIPIVYGLEGNAGSLLGNTTNITTFAAVHGSAYAKSGSETVTNAYSVKGDEQTAGGTRNYALAGFGLNLLGYGGNFGGSALDAETSDHAAHRFLVVDSSSNTIVQAVGTNGLILKSSDGGGRATITSTGVSVPDQFTSTLATGTAPFSIASTTPVAKLGIHNCSGCVVEHKRTAGCATAAVLNATCDTTITWANAFADANYTATCSGDVVTSGVPIVQGIDISAAKTGAAITVRTLAITAAAAQFTTLDCSATHD